MCGFAGAIRLEADAPMDTRDLESRVRAMSLAIANRGPDDDGFWSATDGVVMLAHRRLAIVDLSPRGHQPMHYGNRFVIAFNGEIYNFRDLRTQLSARGHSFASHSDTEVLMAAVQEWGMEGALQRLVGMFAFALWDSRDRVLYLARDRLGEKPLYYGVKDGHLFFGSELHALESVPSLAGEPSDVALALYLRHGYVPTPFAMRSGVAKLPQASYLRVKAEAAGAAGMDGLTGIVQPGEEGWASRYWTVPAGEKMQMSDASAVERLDSLLETAVRDQMQCDVPMGVFLSGGIDSTAVAAVLQRLSENPVSSFTIQFDVPGFDESEHAAAVARHLGTDHHVIRLEPAAMVKSIPRYAASFDEPTANASYFPLRQMAEAARAHVKVVLSGDAGDELFGGYNRYRLTVPLWKRLARIPYPVRRLLARGVSLVPTSLLRGAGRSADVSGQIDPRNAVKKLGRMLDSRELGDCYLRLMRCWDRSSSIAEVLDVDDAPLSCGPSDFLSAATLFDLNHYMPDDNLAKSDRATMAAGIEQRVPLLDHRIVEFARTLPDELMIRDGVTKWILRQAAYRQVPREILDRPKMGFTVPIREWLRGPLREWAGDLLHSDTLIARGRLRPQSVKRYWNKLQNSDAPLAWEMWSIVMYAAWLNARWPGGTSRIGGLK